MALSTIIRVMLEEDGDGEDVKKAIDNRLVVIAEQSKQLVDILLSIHSNDVGVSGPCAGDRWEIKCDELHIADVLIGLCTSEGKTDLMCECVSGPHRTQYTDAALVAVTRGEFIRLLANTGTAGANCSIVVNAPWHRVRYVHSASQKTLDVILAEFMAHAKKKGARQSGNTKRFVAAKKRRGGDSAHVDIMNVPASSENGAGEVGALQDLDEIGQYCVEIIDYVDQIGGTIGAIMSRPHNDKCINREITANDRTLINILIMRAKDAHVKCSGKLISARRKQTLTRGLNPDLGVYKNALKKARARIACLESGMRSVSRELIAMSAPGDDELELDLNLELDRLD